MNNIEDCVLADKSGVAHRIPAWYDDHGNVYVGYSEDEVRTHYSLDNRSLRQDDDADTWFSSSLGLLHQWDGQ